MLLQKKGFVFAHAHHTGKVILLAVFVAEVAFEFAPSDEVVDVDDACVQNHRVDAIDFELEIDHVMLVFDVPLGVVGEIAGRN